MPIRRITSATGVPVSACFNAKAICSSVYLDFFISQLLARRLTRPENSRSDWMKKQGGRQLMLALERLSPLERAAFLLHDVFGVTLADVAITLDRDAGAVRQLAVRARKHVQAERPRYRVEQA